MDRWGLTRLVTWDLPEPQGPLMPSLLPPQAQAMPPHGVHLVLPLHYPVKGDDALLQLVQDEQRKLASSLQIEASFAGVPHHEAYEQMFRLLHLERAMWARRSPGQSDRGLVDLISRAAFKVLGVSAERFKKLRNAGNKCRRGKRVQVSWLRPRARKVRH
jgi:hypothetical protein